MKISKLLPLALALMLVAPAIAAPTQESKSDTATQVLTVPKFIRITHDVDNSVEAATADFDKDYKTITLDKAMSTAFHVVTNNPDEKIKLTVTAKADGAQKNAFTGTSTSDSIIVFTNIGEGARAATAESLTNALGTSKATASNANAIAFALTPGCVVDATSAGAEPTPGFKADGIEYPIQNGIYDFSFSIAKTAVADTFSTHDADGTYQATLTLTQIGS